jgi:hypothetical protein
MMTWFCIACLKDQLGEVPCPGESKCGACKPCEKCGEDMQGALVGDEPYMRCRSCGHIDPS